MPSTHYPLRPSFPEELDQQSHLYYLEDSRLVDDSPTLAPLTRPLHGMSTAVSQCPVSPEHVPVFCTLQALDGHLISVLFRFLVIGHIGVITLWWPCGQFLAELSLCCDDYSRMFPCGPWPQYVLTYTL